MILDHLDVAARYQALHPRFAEAFRFLTLPETLELPPGRHGIDGDALYAMVVRGAGKGGDALKLEQHRRYIDIQFQAAGTDCIGWAPLDVEACAQYDPAADVQFPVAPAITRLTVPPRLFAVFFPHDAHAPMLGCGELHKIVVKVAMI